MLTYHSFQFHSPPFPNESSPVPITLSVLPLPLLCQACPFSLIHALLPVTCQLSLPHTSPWSVQVAAWDDRRVQLPN